MTTRASLAELAASRPRLRQADAVALVSELCGRSAGEESTEPVTVAEAAQVLEELLPDMNAAAEYRASGALRLVIARARGTLDLPPYAGVDDFRAALGRFTAEREAPVTALVRSGSSAVAPTLRRDESALAPTLRRDALGMVAIDAVRRGRRSAFGRWLPAAAVIVLLALGTFAIATEPSRSVPRRPAGAAEALPVEAASLATPMPAATPPPPAAAPPSRAAAHRKRPRATARRRPAAPRSIPTRHHSFFGRELFRIVIK